MKKYNYSKLERLFNGTFKACFMTFILDLIFIASKLPSNQIGFFFTFIFVSQIVAVVGSICIGLPVALLLNRIKKFSGIASALLCGIAVFLFVFYYLNDGILSKHYMKGLVFFTAYGVFCGYAFSKGYKEEILL